MTSTVPDATRSRVTGVFQTLAQRLRAANDTPRPLPAKALLVLDLADQGQGLVYEDGQGRSWAWPSRGQRRLVGPTVDRLYAMDPPLIERGPWVRLDVGDGTDDFRPWIITDAGQQVLAQVWAEMCGGPA